MVRKPSKYGHSDAYRKYESPKRPKRDSVKDLPEEPDTEGFRRNYESNLGRHSVNYGAWFAVKDDGFFSDYWDAQEGKISHKEFVEKYPKTSKFKIEATNIQNNERVVINGESRFGNIESLFGGCGTSLLNTDHFLPFIRIDSSKFWGDGFTIIRSSKLFPRRGTLCFEFVDNDHWPALRRGSAILINEKYVPKDWYGDIKGHREKEEEKYCNPKFSPVVNSICIDCKHFSMDNESGVWYCDYYKEGTSRIPEGDHCEHYEKKEE